MKTKDRDQFMAVFVGNAVKRGAEILIACRAAQDLMRLAGIHNRLSVEACNRSLTDPEKKRLITTESKILGLVDGKNGSGAKAKFGGDPRGYTVKLIFPSGHNNTWGGPDDGWGVPC